MVDKRLKKGEIYGGMERRLNEEVREKIKDVGYEGLSEEEKIERKRIFDMYIEYGDRLERDEWDENRCVRVWLGYGMYGVEFRVMDGRDGIVKEEKMIGGNGIDMVGLIEKRDEKYLNNDSRNYEIESRIVWGYILGVCKSLNVERVYDSENGEWEDWDGYEKVMIDYLNSDIDDYY